MAEQEDEEVVEDWDQTMCRSHTVLYLSAHQMEEEVVLLLPMASRAKDQLHHNKLSIMFPHQRVSMLEGVDAVVVVAVSEVMEREGEVLKEAEEVRQQQQLQWFNKPDELQCITACFVIVETCMRSTEITRFVFSVVKA